MIFQPDNNIPNAEGRYQLSIFLKQSTSAKRQKKSCHHTYLNAIMVITTVWMDVCIHGWSGLTSERAKKASRRIGREGGREGDRKKLAEY
jgi:hypothetical protein